jgi:pheromone shutdown protein TraB
MALVSPSFRLRPTMKQGTASGLVETWVHYPSVEDARAGAKQMYQNDRVLRVMVVIDSVGSFVEWVER